MPQRVLWKQSFVCWHVSASLWLRHIMSERSSTFFCNYCLFETYRSSAYMPRLTCESWWVYDRIKCFTFHMLSILLFYILTYTLFNPFVITLLYCIFPTYCTMESYHFNEKISSSNRYETHHVFNTLLCQYKLLIKFKCGFGPLIFY